MWTHKPSGGREYEILLPLTREVRDFVPRMAEALRTLEAAEARPQRAILDDLVSTPADVVRVRSHYADTTDGTIPLEEGVKLIERARDMLFAAACAAVEPKLYFPTRRPGAAVEYMGRVRMGQTERGSYVVTLISRVPPALEPTGAGQARLDVEDPFERRVTRTLAGAMSALRGAALESAATGDLKPFESAVPKGVSANLCEAIAGMVEPGGAPGDLEISLTWSRLRPMETAEASRITLTADAIPVVGEAGRVLRETAPREDYELVGPVVGLRREGSRGPGQVTIYGDVDGDPRKVLVELDTPEYERAVRAHEHFRFVRCTGHLVKRGNLFELREPRQFAVVEEP